MAVYRFLLRPRWLALTLVVAALAVLMVNLGLWQLRRLDERKDRNARLEQAEDAPVVALGELDGPAGEVEYRRVRARGTYDGDRQVLVANRSFNTEPGFHVLTPLVLDDGTALVVNRGWIPLEQEAVAPDPPGGTTEIVGRVRPGQRRESIGPRDPDEGVLRELSRADVARLQQQVPYPLYDGYVELIEQVPAPGPLPALIPEPDRDDGPHLSYAIQWFTFSLLAVVGWVVVVRREVQGVRGKPARGLIPEDA